MPAVKSSMMEIGTKAPLFELQDCKKQSISNFKSVSGKKGTLVMFVSHHCPYVKHLHSGIKSLWDDYKDKEIGFVAISSNDIENYPDDSPKNMAQLWDTLGLDFPILYDETQEVALDYDAQCTPDFFLFDDQDCCYYRGRFDDSRVGDSANVSGKDLRLALDSLIDGQSPPNTQYPSIGCSIKWKQITK